MKKRIALAMAAIILITSIIVLPHSRGGGLYVHEVLAAERTFNAADRIPAINHMATPLPISDAVSGQTPREGYILAPTLFGLTGIDSLSSFILRTPVNYSASVPEISIDGQSQPEIVREDDNTFIVTPATPLTPNSVYIFRLAREGRGDITWAFQSAARFEIAFTLPRDQSTNVPVRTGIEISFSFGDEIDIEEHFSIYPSVEGRFIHRDSTAVFVPSSPLMYGHIYTVTISPGISLPYTSDVITTGLTFSFETEQESGRTSQFRDSRIHFSNRNVEFPSFAQPEVSFWLNYGWDRERPSVEMSVYQLRNRADGIAAANRLSNVPHWTQIFDEDRLIDTSGLTRVASARIDERHEDPHGWGRNEIFALPNSLSPGFYVLNAVVEGYVSQMIIQITDLAMQIIADDNMALVWVNDMTSGLPAAGAVVFDPITNRTYETSAYGIAVVERELLSGEYLIITAENGREAVAFVHSWGHGHHWGIWGPWGGPWGGSPQSRDYYWTALQLDRTLFQRSDTLSFWGFVQNRHQHEGITHVTAVLTERSWWHWYASGSDRLLMQNVPVRYGSYSGEIRLPNLSPGTYELTIYHGDIMLSSIFFSVDDYVTPPYQLIVTSDREAIFAGEEVTFTARAEFFEGTPVPDLSISYHFWAWGVTTPASGQRRTDLEGNVEITARPTVTDTQLQGESSMFFSVDATLPEIGHVFREARTRVFVNDISVRPRSSRDGADANITIDVHKITLERINNETAESWNDYLCEPIAGQVISVEVMEVYWERVPVDERYCHIRRQVVTRYQHERREITIEQFEMTTDAEGNASRDFQVPNLDRRSYMAKLRTRDGNGRLIEHTVFLGRDFARFHFNADDDQLFLYGVNEDGYDIGDTVELTLKQGLYPVERGNFLFVVVQGGILSYHIGTNPLTITFGEQHVPNAQVFAYHFNGHTYESNWSMSERLRFNPESRKLAIDISTCNEYYRPGDMKTVTLTVTDSLGNPKAANVNISLVDEALFALMEYNVDTFAMLYRNVSDNLRFNSATHRTFRSDGIIEDAPMSQRLALGQDAAPLLAGAPAPASPAAPGTALMMADTMAESAVESRIRERFEDTAVFKSLRTNARGEATFTFRLPDNITSWRMTASAISEDLYAGNAVQNVRVTQPMFLHYTLNNVFLAGDIPYIGVNAFGSSLTGGEAVTFEVWREDMPADIRRASGVSFERVNIPLWEMTEEGFGVIVIRATMENGYNDAILHSYQVLNSHRHVDIAIFYEDVTIDTVFETNPGGLTNITFTDRGRGQFLNDLFSLRNIWGSGARIEGLVARREATWLIKTHFPEIDLFGTAGNFDVLEYQTGNGGIAILPYADADLYMTVKLLPFILDDINIAALRRYLQDVFDNSTTDNRMLALYGLALLGEPVLLDLQRYAMLSDLSVRNTAYIALGFAALGDMHTARDLFNSRIAPYIQAIAPYYRINTGTNRADILDATSVAALLAAQLNMPQSMGLHNYAARHRFDAPHRFEGDAMLLNIERLLFISHEINNHTDAAAGITYTLFGETVTRELRPGGSFNLRIPAQNMNEFNLTSITGDVSAISIIRTPLEELEPVEGDIIVSRTFSRAGENASRSTFEQGDLVRVQITINYAATAPGGSYMITDFLPAGLVHVANSARFGDRDHTTGRWAHAAVEGQRITFFDFNSRRHRVNTYYYYARVINPGTFMAEGTIVQSVGAREYMVVGESAVLRINP